MDRQPSGAYAPFNNLAKGTHICYFYANHKDLADAVVPYLKAGVENNERCIWVCAEPFDAEAARALLRQEHPELAGLLQMGHLTVVDYQQVYLTGNSEFDISAVLDRWSAEVSDAINAGFDGLRVAGDLSWLRSSPSLQAYEERFCAFSMQEPIVALCFYPAAGRDHIDMLQISYMHHFVLLPSQSSWHLVPSARHRDLIWQSLLDTLTKGMLVIDTSGAIITASNRFLELFGCTALSGLGSDVQEFASRFNVSSITGRVRPEAAHLVSSGDVDDYWRAKSPSHGDLELLVNIKAAKPNAIIPEVLLLIFHDITGLRTRDTIDGNFLQVVSHELKNPIQTMRAIINLMKSSLPDPEIPVYKYIQLADSCLSRITGIVEDLLSTGQINKDTTVINPVLASLKTLLVEALEPYLTNPRHMFIRRFDKQRSVPAIVDPVRIHQILANVINNAVKYTPPGKRIWVDLLISDGTALLVVEDEGIGIAPSELERVFDQFYRGSKTRDKFSGVGLGLYVSRFLARMHGGDLWAETRPQGGTVIKLSLPVLTDNLENPQEGEGMKCACSRD